MSTPANAPYLQDEASYLAHVRALWHEQRRDGVPREPRYPLGERPLTEYLRHWARQRGEQAALIFYGRRVSWAELDAASDRFAALLVQRGLQPGDRVACFLPNCPQFLIVFFGVLKAGCVHVPVNPMFTEAELIYELQDTAARVLVAHDQLLELAAHALPQSQVRHCFATSFLDFLPESPQGALPAGLLTPRIRHAAAEDLMAALAACDAPAPQGRSSLDALAALNYTGGTTGMPKGCMHTQRNMLYTGAVMSSISADIGPEDVVVNFWPVFWVAGEDVAILLTVTTGATCVLMARWDPIGFVEAVQRNRASAAFMLVDNTVQVMELPSMTGDNAALRTLRQTLVASFVKKLNVDFRRRWQQLTGATLREAAWGMTETHSFDTATRGWQDEDRDLLGRQIFCGLPVPGTEFKILEFGSQRLLPLGEEGELCVRSPSLLKGYWQREEATAQAIQDGWLRTGDLGMIGSDGCVYFLGRRKEMLKVKGMSVFPAEIEAVLGQHPAVTGSGVIGREDEARGQVPVAFITVGDVSADTEAMAANIGAFCRQRLAVYKVPEIRIVKALPMTATGKVRKNELAELLTAS